MKPSKLPFKAVIFDLDGVITKTAVLHALAWEKMFNHFLIERNKQLNQNIPLYIHPTDYLNYVDGRPRYEGVEQFLQSRNIDLPFGKMEDDISKQTICGLGNAKNHMFHELLQQKGVEVYPATLDFIHQLESLSIKLAVASSSKNCKQILEKVGLSSYFPTRVDGVYLAEHGLKGKPCPDIFLTAAQYLNVNPMDAIVVEDAASGVEAAKNGGFGLVIGLAREDNQEDLIYHGADIVVSDLSEISMNDITQWFEKDLPQKQWRLTYHDYNPKLEKSRESLLTVGNGFMATRGAFEEVSASENHYPGTYLAGVYNKLSTNIQGKEVENEDFVNFPDWTLVQFKVENEIIIPNQANILKIYRHLNLQTGLLYRELEVKSKKGHRFKVVSKRFVSMDNPHQSSISYQITSLDYKGKITLISTLNGNIINAGVDRYKNLNQNHLLPYQQGAKDYCQWLIVKTIQSDIYIKEKATLFVYKNDKKVSDTFSHHISDGVVVSSIDVEIGANASVTLEKNVTISHYDAKTDKAIMLQGDDSIKSLSHKQLFENSKKQWQKLWQKIDLPIQQDRKTQLLLRLHQYHLLVSASSHNTQLDVGIPARGLHGEAYRGHVFWDEVFIMPYYLRFFPNVAKSLLMYRYRRLDAAKEIAKSLGQKGAAFPWQSASTGEEETQKIHLNPISGQWHDDLSALQYHVSLAIAYNVWTYFQHTKDVDFMMNAGLEMIWNICLFFADKAIYDTSDNRFHLLNVMGPDEFHEKYPQAKQGGIHDNAYTNVMTVWMLQKSIDLYEEYDDKKSDLINSLSIDKQEIKHWKSICKNMYIPIKDDIIEQFQGYFDLEALDWEFYRRKYKDIQRLDRVLKAEGKTPDSYQLSKQADVLMMFYLLPIDEIKQIFLNLGYKMGADFFNKNFEYYYQRTSHGSTLSKLVHAKLAKLKGDDKLAQKLYQEALESDYSDVQGGTTAEGIHTGVMAGTVILALNDF